VPAFKVKYRVVRDGQKIDEDILTVKNVYPETAEFIKNPPEGKEDYSERWALNEIARRRIRGWKPSPYPWDSYVNTLKKLGFEVVKVQEARSRLRESKQRKLRIKRKH